MVTSNHTHLLVKDTGPNVIAQSIQLIAGRTAQEYNQRKGRQGAFWEDRYHATAIDTDEHLHRCLVYIDLNMVRAGVVKHPLKWEHNGYHEIQEPPKRYAVIDLPGVIGLCGFSELADFQQAHRRWIEGALDGELIRDDSWSEAIAVGSGTFVERVKSELGVKATHREIVEVDRTYACGNRAKLTRVILVAKTIRDAIDIERISAQFCGGLLAGERVLLSPIIRKPYPPPIWIDIASQ